MISRVTASGSGLCGVLAFVLFFHFFIYFALLTDGVGFFLGHFISFT